MPTNDSAFKILLSYAPQQFVDVLLPGARFLEQLSTELAREPLRADVLLLVEYPAGSGRHYILHLEAQTDADATMPRRLCEYTIWALGKYHLPVLSIVIYLERGATPPSPWTVPGPFGNVLTFEFIVLRLWETPVEQWLAPGHPGLTPFAPLLQGATVETLGQVADRLQDVPEPVQRANALYYAVSFAKRAFGVAATNEFLRRHPVIDAYIKDSPFYQEIIDLGREQGLKQGREQGRELGLEQGLEQGIVAGETEALRTAVIAVLARRFPELTAAPATIAAITDLARLRLLVVEVAVAPDVEAVRRLLDLP